MTMFRDLIVWQKAMDLTEKVYLLARQLPKEETYALSDQLRRAAISIPSNIAEGYKRDSDKEFLRFLSIANGSCAEVETQLLIAVRLGMLSEETVQDAMNLCTETSKLINAFIKKIKTRL